MSSSPTAPSPRANRRRSASADAARLRGSHVYNFRFNGTVLFSLETDSLKLCVQVAVEQKISLCGADLRGASLSGAYLKAEPDEIARLDAVRDIILSHPERLNMTLWHGEKWNPDHTPEEEHSCGTPHCLAGWLQALSPDKEIRQMEAEAAGRKLAPVASGLFFASKSIVFDFLKERWYAGDTKASA